MSTISLIQKEVDRARSQYPEKTSMTMLVGLIFIKLQTLHRLSDAHKLVTKPALKGIVAVAAIQIAAVCVRYVEESLGGLSEAEYELNNSISDDIKQAP